MSTDLLARLEEWKSRFGAPDTGALEKLLVETAGERFATAGALIRLHEALLFLRAYPPSRKAARLADEILFAFARRVSGLQAAGEDPSEF